MKLDDLKAELDDAAKGLAYNSIQNGCADCGLAANLATRSLTAITDLEALVGELGEALKPFAYIRTQMPESIKLIQKNVDGMKPITITVTKAQMQTAVATLAKLEKARGKDQTDG